MQSASGFQSLALRFAPYIAELHQFLSGCNVAFGSPGDIQPFTDKLSVPGYLRDGICAMIRAIIYREHEAVSHLELLDFMLVGVGGTELDIDSTGLEASKRKLSRLIGQAMTSLWSMPHANANRRTISDERMNEDLPHGQEPTALPPVITANTTAAIQRPAAEFEVAPASSLQASIWSAAANLAANDEAMLASPDLTPLRPTPAPEPVPRVPVVSRAWSQPPAPEITGPDLSSKAESERIVWAMPPRMVWIAGACALLLAPVLNLAFGHHSRHTSAVAVRRAVEHKVSTLKPLSSTFHTELRPLSATQPASEASPLTAAAELNDSAVALPHAHHRRMAIPASASITPGVRSGQSLTVAAPAFAANIPARETDMPGPDHGWTATTAETDADSAPPRTSVAPAPQR